MRGLLICVWAFTTAIGCMGCGKSGPVLLKIKGQVVKDGKNFVPEEGQAIQIVFTPISPDGKPARNLYVAVVDNKTGSFFAAGQQLQGMPPGKYRAGIELRKGKKDLLGDKFNLEDSPFVFDIDEKTRPIVIDLDKGPENKS